MGVMGIFLIMDNAGFISSTASPMFLETDLLESEVRRKPLGFVGFLV